MGLLNDTGPQLDFYQKFVRKIILKYQVILKLNVYDFLRYYK